MLAFHNNHGKEGTIMVTRVDEPSKYGVVVCHEGTNLIDRFVEKPTVFVSNQINAGLYVFSTGVLNRIKAEPTSIEKDIFPLMAKNGELHAMDLPGYWMDVGQPRDFLLGSGLYLSALAKSAPLRLAVGDNFVGHVLMDETAEIGTNCKIGPNVVLGKGVVIGDGVRINRSVIFDGVEIKDHSVVMNSVIGWKSSIGKWSRVEGVSVLGEDVTIKDEIYLNGATILPHKSVAVSVPDPKIIM